MTPLILVLWMKAAMDRSLSSLPSSQKAIGMSNVEFEDFIALLESKFTQLHSRQRAERADEQAILPSRLPLKRRLAEYRWGTTLGTGSLSSTSQTMLPGNPPTGVNRKDWPAILDPERFKSGVYAIEKFRDMSPSFVIALSEDYLVVEPGEPPIAVPYSHPLAGQLLEAINSLTLPDEIMPILLGRSAPMYDGCVIVGLVDYRKESFGNLSSAAGSKSGAKNTALQMLPEMHKILLRPTHSALMAGLEFMRASEHSAKMRHADPLELEKALIDATASPICLDPSVAVMRTMNALNYDCHKMRTCLKPLNPPEALNKNIDLELAEEGFEALFQKATQSQIKLSGFKQLALIEDLRAKQAAADALMYAGLDTNKKATLSLAQNQSFSSAAATKPGQKSPSPSNLHWLPTGHRLWRTIRFEQVEASPSRLSHYTIHITISPANYFEVFLRAGHEADTAINGFSYRAKFLTKGGVEQYIWGIKWLFSFEDNRGRRCVADISNPSALSMTQASVQAQSPLPSAQQSSVSPPIGLEFSTRKLPMKPLNPISQKLTRPQSMASLTGSPVLRSQESMPTLAPMRKVSPHSQAQSAMDSEQLGVSASSHQNVFPQSSQSQMDTSFMGHGVPAGLPQLGPSNMTAQYREMQIKTAVATASGNISNPPSQRDVSQWRALAPQASQQTSSHGPPTLTTSTSTRAVSPDKSSSHEKFRTTRLRK